MNMLFEQTSLEKKAFVVDAKKELLSQLSEMELALVGGGSGDVSLG